MVAQAGNEPATHGFSVVYMITYRMYI